MCFSTHLQQKHPKMIQRNRRWLLSNSQKLSSREVVLHDPGYQSSLSVISGSCIVKDYYTSKRWLGSKKFHLVRTDVGSCFWKSSLALLQIGANLSAYWPRVPWMLLQGSHLPWSWFHTTWWCLFALVYIWIEAVNDSIGVTDKMKHNGHFADPTHTEEREDIVELGIYLLPVYFSRRDCQLFLSFPWLLYRSLSKTKNGKLSL